MRVGYISQAAIPSRSADSIQVMKACEAFSGLGVSLHLHVPYRRVSEEERHDVFSYYDVERIFEIKWTKSHILPDSFSIFYIAITAGLSNYDFIFTRSIPAALIAAFFGKKVVVEIHEPLNRSRFISIFSSLLVRLENTRGIITNCNALKLHTNKHYPRVRGKTIAIHNAARIAKLVAPIDLGNKSRIHIGYSGQLYKGKGLEVIKELAPMHPDMTFHIVGGLHEDIEYWKNQLKDAENVVFHGFIEPSELARYIAAFNIVLAPYQRVIYGYKAKNNLSEWTSPMKIFDYMSLGKAIIASDLAFMHEVLVPEEEALFCNPEDVSAWSKAITRLVDNPALAKKLGNAAHERFLNEFLWEKRAEKVLSFIKTVA